MAPTRPHSKNAKSKARRLKKRAAGAGQRTKPAKQLMVEAMASLEQGDVNAALAAATEALDVLSEESGADSNSGIINSSSAALARQRQTAAALSLLGEIHLEMGDPDQARAFFLRAVEVDGEENSRDNAEDEDVLLLSSGPSTGGGTSAGGNRAEKFLWLAQLSEDGGVDSVRWYERGATELRSQLARLDAMVVAAAANSKTTTTSTLAPAAASPTAAAATSEETPAKRHAELLEDARRDRARRLASALCAVAEVYMTDLSWEADAEQRCEALVTEATLLAPDSAEAWQTVANVRISQGRGDDARAALRRSLEAWADLDPEDPRVPAFASRVSLVRLLLEVGWEEKAVEVAERLAREDDESVEVLYLGGFGQFLLGEKLRKGGSDRDPADPADPAAAVRKEKEKEVGGEGAAGAADDWRPLWVSARRWLKQCLALFAAQEYEDDRLGEHAQELLGQLNKELGEDDRDEEDDDGWEDADDDGEDDDGDEEMQG